jgi:hypothetical protein
MARRDTSKAHPSAPLVQHGINENALFALQWAPPAEALRPNDKHRCSSALRGSVSSTCSKPSSSRLATLDA